MKSAVVKTLDHHKRPQDQRQPGGCVLEELEGDRGRSRLDDVQSCRLDRF
jgi:hypothetical protein